jgi:hypothetical protein
MDEDDRTGEKFSSRKSCVGTNRGLLLGMSARANRAIVGLEERKEINKDGGKNGEAVELASFSIGPCAFCPLNQFLPEIELSLKGISHRKLGVLRDFVGFCDK